MEMFNHLQLRSTSLLRRRRPAALVLRDGSDGPDGPNGEAGRGGSKSPKTPDTPDTPNSRRPPLLLLSPIPGVPIAPQSAIDLQSLQQLAEELQSPPPPPPQERPPPPPPAFSQAIALEAATVQVASTTLSTATQPRTATQPTQSAQSTTASALFAGETQSTGTLLESTSQRQPITQTAGFIAAPSESSTVNSLPESSQSTSTPVPVQPGISNAARGVLIGFGVLGIFGIIALSIWLLRRRRQRNILVEPNQATRPMTTHSLFGSGSPARPVTIMTTSTRFEEPSTQQPSIPKPSIQQPSAQPTSVLKPAIKRRPIPPPPPSANPFRETQLVKTYELLRGNSGPKSPRAQSWLRNPFEDPEDTRFDPFGEIRDKQKSRPKK